MIEKIRKEKEVKKSKSMRDIAINPLVSAIGIAFNPVANIIYGSVNGLLLINQLIAHLDLHY